jgi:hypothetical protein
VTGQRSNQLNYVPTLFSYLYRKPASLVAFLRFNRFAGVARFNLPTIRYHILSILGEERRPPKLLILRG